MISIHKSLKSNAHSILTAIAAAGLLGLAALPSQVAAASSPFVGMSGSWSGGGVITMSNGSKERIRCRARYDVGGGGSNLDLTLRCASDSFKFELQSNVAHSNGSVSGRSGLRIRVNEVGVRGSWRGIPDSNRHAFA